MLDFEPTSFVRVVEGGYEPVAEADLADDWIEDLDIIEMITLPLSTYIALRDVDLAAAEYVGESGSYAALEAALREAFDSLGYEPALQPRDIQRALEEDRPT